MRKLRVAVVLLILVVLSSSSVVSADQPPGVSRAHKMTAVSDENYLWYLDENGETIAVYICNDPELLYSNGATWHIMERCRATLIEGTPQHDSFTIDYGDVRMHWTVVGDFAIMVEQGKLGKNAGS